jgi:hypothetical protein
MRQYNYLQQTREIDRSDRSGGGCDLDWAERGRADELLECNDAISNRILDQMSDGRRLKL